MHTLDGANRWAASCKKLVRVLVQAGLAFPAILERLSLPAFDLCKALQPFMAALPSPPK
jgi:hypothetical protein